MITIKPKETKTIETMKFYEMLIGNCFDYADSTEAPLIAMKISEDEAFVFETEEVVVVYYDAYLPMVNLEIEWTYRTIKGVKK